MTEKLPPPEPEKFPKLSDEYVRVLPAETLIGRIHFTGGDWPYAWNWFRSYGPTKCRFDHHPPPPSESDPEAILYAAPLVMDANGQQVPPLDTCLVEVFRDTGTVDPDHNEPYFALFRMQRPLRLLDLVDSNWVTRAGGNAAASSGDRSCAREWSRAIYDHYGAGSIDGLYYGCSNMPRGRCIALYETANDSLRASPEINMALNSAGLWADVDHACTDLGLDLVRSRPGLSDR